MASKNINKDLICQESLALIKEGGLAKLSMRNLAARLGIKAPSLYVHIKNKADLIILLQAYAFKANQLIGSLDPANSNWQDYIYNIMQNMRKFFLDNPWMFELFAAYNSNSEESQQTLESYLTKMQTYGFSLEEAAYIGRVMRVFVIGHVEFEYNSNVNTSEHPSLPIKINEKFKNVYMFHVTNGGYNHEKSFDFGAKLIIHGCEKLLSSSDN